ncbi:MAG: hypothetical protein KF764_32350 [Labilithrix sp.]|nr:hypothetical protein [Labilithrix sp.]
MFEDDLHARRVLLLANGATGVLRTAPISVHAIGEGYADVARTKQRFGVRQVDRFLSNDCRLFQRNRPGIGLNGRSRALA